MAWFGTCVIFSVLFLLSKHLLLTLSYVYISFHSLHYVGLLLVWVVYRILNKQFFYLISFSVSTFIYHMVKSPQLSYQMNPSLYTVYFWLLLSLLTGLMRYLIATKGHNMLMTKYMCKGSRLIFIFFVF